MNVFCGFKTGKIPLKGQAATLLNEVNFMLGYTICGRCCGVMRLPSPLQLLLVCRNIASTAYLPA